MLFDYDFTRAGLLAGAQYLADGGKPELAGDAVYTAWETFKGTANWMDTGDGQMLFRCGFALVLNGVTFSAGSQ